VKSMPKSPARPPIIEVHWVDIASFPGWSTLEEAITSTTMECISIGYVIHKDKKSVVMAQTIADNGDVGEILCIPTSVIRELREICPPLA